LLRDILIDDVRIFQRRLDIPMIERLLNQLQ